MLAATTTTTTTTTTLTQEQRSKRRAQRRAKRVLLSPTTLTRSPPPPSLFQVSLHQIPSHLQDEVKLVFPGVNEILRAEDDDANKEETCGEISSSSSSSSSSPEQRVLLAIPTVHACGFNVLERNEMTEQERMRVFTRFAHFSNIFTTLLKRQDVAAFADFVDIDGGASTTPGGQAIYDEVMSCKALLGYKLTRYCGVTMVVHPEAGWKRLVLHTIIVCGRPSVVKDVLVTMVEGYTISADGAEKGEMT